MGDVPAGLDLSKLAQSANRAPDRLGGCDFDVAGRVWVPKGAIGQASLGRTSQERVLPWVLYF